MPRSVVLDTHIAVLALEHMDESVVICTVGGELRFANQAARTLLRSLGGDSLRLPPPLARAMRAADEAAAVVLPGGRRYRLKCKPLAAGQLLLLSLRPEVQREQDLRERLTRSYGLAPRECDLVMCMRSGMRNQAIADHMKVSLGTVKYYASRVYAALGVNGRAALLARLDGLTRA